MGRSCSQKQRKTIPNNQAFSCTGRQLYEMSRLHRLILFIPHKFPPLYCPEGTGYPSMIRAGIIHS